MTISYPLSLPATPGFSAFTLRQQTTVGVSQSPYTAEQQVYEFSGQWWEADCSLPEMSRADANLWRAFVTSLNGRRGTFLMGDPTAATPQGLLGGTPLSMGGAAVGSKVLPIDGCSNSINGWLKAGDFLQTGTGATSRLYMNLADANTNGSGQVTLDIWPAIRLAVADNDPIVVTNCKGLFRMIANTQVDSSRPFPFYSRSFTAQEAL